MNGPVVLLFTLSFHIVFAILEVLRYDFPGVYQSLVSSLEFYAYIQYPGYRWPLVKWLKLKSVKMYLKIQNSYEFAHKNNYIFTRLVPLHPQMAEFKTQFWICTFL